MFVYQALKVRPLLPVSLPNVKNAFSAWHFNKQATRKPADNLLQKQRLQQSGPTTNNAGMTP